MLRSSPMMAHGGQLTLPRPSRHKLIRAGTNNLTDRPYPFSLLTDTVVIATFRFLFVRPLRELPPLSLHSVCPLRVLKELFIMEVPSPVFFITSPPSTSRGEVPLPAHNRAQAAVNIHPSPLVVFLVPISATNSTFRWAL